MLQRVVPGTVGRRRYDPEYVAFEPRLRRDDTTAVIRKTGQFFTNQAFDALCDLTSYFRRNTFVESDLIT
ncbi:hypothetical protein EVC45_30175 [Paraburkholderia sp. UYCP14C]|nr:hypothetical protein EVC45_30175 [Paraburkholderia sp. UYCP14C]